MDREFRRRGLAPARSGIPVAWNGTPPWKSWISSREAVTRRHCVFRWDPPVLDAIEIGPRRVHTLRGPRQVGKSTTAKRIIKRLLDGGERRILYFSFDLSTTHSDIAEVVHRARQLHPDPEGPWYLFLDEVTTMPQWQLGIKYIVDSGLSNEDFIFCAGPTSRRPNLNEHGERTRRWVGSQRPSKIFLPTAKFPETLWRCSGTLLPGTSGILGVAGSQR